jgi:hypothetical protein
MTLLFIILIFWFVGKLIKREEKKLGRSINIKSFWEL